MSTYKYLIVYAHADVRETGGLLTEDTPKGWGNIEIEVDHEIREQEDFDEISRQIARNETLEDGSPRYTHLAINEIKLLDASDNHFEEKSRSLTEADFTFKRPDGSTISGVPIGDDDYWVLWGHVTSDEARDAIQAYWDVVTAGDKYHDEYVASNISDSAIRHTWAVATFYEDIDDWSLEWANKTEFDEGAIAITLVQLP